MFERITGYSREEVIGQKPKIFSSGETPKAQYADLWETITTGKTWRGEFKNRKKNGEPYWIKGVISPIKNERGQITHFLSIQEDISEKILAEQKAHYLSTYDTTTGLLNRETFLHTLEDLLSRKQRGVLFLMDLDEFKLINEAYGHHVGDEFLKCLAACLRKYLTDLFAEKTWFIGRPGGDEFAIGIQGQTGQDGWTLAEDIRKKVERFTFSEDIIRTSISTGIVEFPLHGGSAQELLRRADAAMIQAKKSGKNACHLFCPDDWHVELVHSRLQEKERIISAIEEDRFEPWFQPILDLRDYRVHHYEALARMRNHDGKIILPGAFISTAESLGLIASIDRMITQKTIYYQAELKQQGHPLTFTMNLSGKHLGDEKLLDFLKTVIEHAGAEPHHLIFEITETAAIQDMERAIAYIHALKGLGCRFALEDFGVGFTSFVYLKEMHVDFIKIDGSFIRRLHEHRSDQGITKAMATVAKDMDMKTIAEFVEQEATLQFLKEFGVDYAQGFLIGKPSPVPRF
jgi:diguanylate cyclase (GGDEF)-like protein/PAS domain S-box-containing protein